MMFRGLRGEVRTNEPMSGHTSFRIGGPADAFVLPEDRDDLITLLAEVREQGLPYLVVGSGTNLLVKDRGFRGVVICLKKICSIEVEREYRSLGGSFAVLCADAGASLPRLLAFTLEHGLTGLEFATGIPGTVGGAVCMNAGTARGEFGDVVDTVTMLAPAGDLVQRQRDEMGFGYRTASVPPGHIVLDTKIVLRYGDTAKIRSQTRKLMEQRKDRQPWGLPNAGSMFRNPLDEAAGKLIETAGCKGLVVGGAQVSDKHANFIVNTGNAKAADVLKLMEIVRERVLETHGVRLEPEITIVGED